MSFNVDMRFADEEDTTDLISFISKALEIEQNGTSSLSFRKVGPIITANEIETDCSSFTVRWIVFESPYPEEDILACARLTLLNSSTERKGVVNYFCVPTSSDHKDMLHQLVISKVEIVCRSQGYTQLVYELPQWREDLHESLSRFGYTDNGGRCWPEEQSHMITKPTMILEFEKDLRIPAPPSPPPPPCRLVQIDNISATENIEPTSANVSDSASRSSELLREDLLEAVVGIDGSAVDAEEAAAASGNDIMSGLLKDLIGALHSEYDTPVDPN